MSEAIEFVLPEPPAAFLQRLSRYGADWHDSRLPPALRAQFVTGFQVRLRGEEFTLTVKPGYRGSQAVCVGAARADPAGCRVTARTVPAPGAHVPWLAMAASIALAAIAAIGGMRWWQAVALAALVLGLEEAAVALSLRFAVRRHGRTFGELFAHLQAHPEAGSRTPAA